MAVKKDTSNRVGIIIELKAAKNDGENLNNLAENALKQIETQQYLSELNNYAVEKIFKLGIAFFKDNLECAFKI